MRSMIKESLIECGIQEATMVNGKDNKGGGYIRHGKGDKARM